MISFELGRVLINLDRIEVYFDHNCLGCLQAFDVICNIRYKMRGLVSIGILWSDLKTPELTE